MCNSFVFRVLLLNGLLEYCVFRQKERQKGLQRPRWRLKCFYSDLRILSIGSQAILWHPAMSFAFLEYKQDMIDSITAVLQDLCDEYVELVHRFAMNLREGSIK